MAKLIIFSGAGLSAESGLSTFRDNNGLWAKHDPMEVCNYKNWLKNFNLVHDFYNLRRKELKQAKPNDMHKFLAKLSSIFESSLQKQIEIIHVTQNVDDLLERAGVENVVHLHGELTKIICPQCETILNIGYEEFMPHDCETCGYKYLKPFIVFFFEEAPKYRLLHQVFSNLTNKDCVVVIGTSANVIDINSLLIRRTGQEKIGFKILNNLEYSPNIMESLFDMKLYMTATQAINSIQEGLIDFFNKSN
ncbi:SIR2 family NAD-dependent protein deacylase [Helicobacter muridarum]|uniref:protein acetyllysine N-acetyltransferase n=1 Tax=Helicobacter muridarum TaxID=216 RepID=A0A099TUX5_9HELI|nr:Sir2 family NAD-dependent protein deacetylase [Helicobacter muridarum]STQ86243.1 NAD-dependent deacetylase [Helicobacter muridarum]